MSGYTTYNNTLWNNIKSLDAGSFLFLNSNNKIKTEKYFEYNPWKFNSNKNINYKFQLKIEYHDFYKQSLTFRLYFLIIIVVTFIKTFIKVPD